jgi:phage terminase large subunit GpA-like protein
VLLANRKIEGLEPSRRVTFSALARGLRPPRRRTVDVWAEERRYVSRETGSPLPGKWSNATGPHLVEIMQCLSLSQPCETVTFKKSAQVGGTEAGVNLFGQIVEDDPSPMLILLPTTDEVKKYVRIKLQPSIDVTPTLKALIREQKSRDEDSSTTTFKKFPGGYLQVAGANSSSALQMVTYRVVVAEEISEYPFDLDGRGDPLEMAFQRTQAWEGRRKIFYNSTPGIAGQCRVSAKYEISDQRRYYVPCPHCGVFQVFKWERLDREALDPTYCCGRHGCIIEHGDKPRMMGAGVWLKCFPGEGCPPEFVAPEQIAQFRARESEGRDPGFAINGLYSLFKSWRQIVKEWREASGSQEKEKVFCQQVLGEAWTVKGDAPDHQKLFDSRAKYSWRQVPLRALLLTGACDVQGDRLEWAIYAYGAGFDSWLIDKGVIEGDPNGQEPWVELDKVFARQWPDQRGKPWSLDAFAVDAGYLSQQVYRWTRRYVTTRKVFAIKGVPGWSAPAIGTPGKVDIDYEGRKIGQALIWPVGTWNQKSEVYSGIGKLLKGPNPETGEYPIGTAFYGDACDLTYCEQLTAEQVVMRKAKSGATEMVWEVVNGRRNEALDLAVYSRALAHHLADGLTPDQWAALAAQRGAPPEDVQRDLAQLWSPLVGDQVSPPRTPETAQQERQADDTTTADKDWIAARGDYWKGR